VKEAYAINNPLLYWIPKEEPETNTSNPEPFSLTAVDQPNLVIETIKRAEDDQGLIIRLYETQRKRGPFTLKTGFPISKAWRTNILEENQEALAVEENQVKGFIKPYQIVTIRIIPEV
jgi:alpha-mannosidase